MDSNMDKEENLVFRHLLDLAKLSFARDISVFSDFLNNREVAILKRQVADLPLGRFFLYGGIEDAERVMVCFPASYEDREDIKFPIECVEITIKSVKYENNSLTHRDFLGAILGLGIERKLIGDIFTESENGSIVKAFVFCKDKITDFLISELRQIGRCNVSAQRTSVDKVMVCRRIEDKYGTVPSLRLDVIIGEALNLSRTKVKALIDGDKVAVNSAASSTSHYQVSEGDVISVRGFGKFIFYGSLGKTKKDRLQIHIGKYC